MQRILRHIEQIHEKPHHVRKRIAFGAAGAGAAFIALVWLATSLSTGAFAIRGASFADSAGAGNSAADSAGASGLAGAAAALPASAPAHIEIVDVASSTGKAKQAEQTTIPF